MATTSREELQVCLEIATEAALSAGAVLLEYWGKLEAIEEKGRPGDLVTEADKASEARIVEVLRRHFPRHSILAEESGQLDGSDSDRLWAIDPLDGTTNYAHQYPVFSVSVALLVENVPRVGVVYNPFRDELYRAAEGLGATRDRRPIRVSEVASLNRALLATGFAYDRRETSDNNYAEFCHLNRLTQGTRRGGSAALDLAHVARGCLDGYWERGLSPWDMAAGVVLVREAGGTVTAYDGSPFSLESGRVLATNGHLHASTSEALANAPGLKW